MNYKRKSSTLILLKKTIALLIFLPMVSLFISYIFHSDVIMDKPKIVEEAIKSIVTLFLSIVTLIASENLSMYHIEKKSNELKQRIHLLISSMNEQIDRIMDSEILDKSSLEKMSIEEIRNYSFKEKFILNQIKNINNEFENIRNDITSSDPEIGKNCLDYLFIVTSCIISNQDFIHKPSKNGMSKIKNNLQSLRTKIDN